jgi:hypothetical protein
LRLGLHRSGRGWRGSIPEAAEERPRARGFRRVVGDGVSVTWSPVRGRPAFDDKAIREAAARAGVDLAQYEVVGEPTDRLVIRVAEQSRSAA